MLTPQEENFCQLYVSHSNATQAYYKSHKCAYSTANNNGCQLLKRPEIKDRIQCLVEEFNAEWKISKDETIKELMQAAIDCKIEKKYREYQKIRDMIIKLQGFYEPTKFEIESEVNINIIVPGITAAPNTDAENAKKISNI